MAERFYKQKEDYSDNYVRSEDVTAWLERCSQKLTDLAKGKRPGEAMQYIFAARVVQSMVGRFNKGMDSHEPG